MGQNLHDMLNEITEQGKDLRAQAADRLLNDPFPIEAFPEQVKSIILETHRVSKFPQAYTGSAMLAAVATAIGNTYEIDINGVHKGIASLFIIGVGISAAGKSAPFEWAMAPHAKRDIRAFAEYEKKWGEKERIAKMPEGERKNQGIEIPNEPILSKILIDDYTPEVLLKTMKYNPRGLCAYNDEFAENLQNQNRYNKSGAESKLIKMLDGRPCASDRITANRAINIPKPCLSLVGTLQVGMLKELAGGNRNISGYLFRALFAFPEIGDKEYKTDEIVPRLDQTFVDCWKNVIDRLSEIRLDIDETFTPIPRSIHITRDAESIHRVWFNQNVDHYNDAESDSIKSICGKLEVQVYRLALVLQLLNYVTGEGLDTCIEVKAMKGAIALIEYYRTTAIKVQNIIAEINPLETMAKDKRTFYDILPSSFTKADAEKLAATIKKGKKPAALAKWVQRFLAENDKKLFQKQSHGNYSKIITEEHQQAA